MSIPVIHTAIPQRRYQMGEFIVTVLGEIDSGDGIDYHYILATTREGDSSPNLFVSAERQSGPGGPTMRVSMPDGEQVLGRDEAFSDLEAFIKQGLAVVRSMLNLSDEAAHRLM